jgi:hypothetical protein
MSNAVGAAVKASLEGFVNADNTAERKEANITFVAALITFIIALVILSLIGKLLWNGVVVELFSFARPAKSIWQILGLFVFVSLLYC